MEKKRKKIENGDGGKLPTIFFFFFFFFFFAFHFQNHWNLFWVYQNGNFLPEKNISRREKNQENWLCPLWKIFLLTPLIISHAGYLPRLSRSLNSSIVISSFKACWATTWNAWPWICMGWHRVMLSAFKNTSSTTCKWNSKRKWADELMQKGIWMSTLLPELAEFSR